MVVPHHVSRYEEVLLVMPTPINASGAYTFGLPVKNVETLCVEKSYFYHNGGVLIPTFLLQLSIATFLTNSCKRLLKPFIQASIVGQIMGGIIAGPSALARNPYFLIIAFPARSIHIIRTFASFGCIFFVFIVGIKTDVSLIRYTGNKEWKIGISAFLFPVLAGIPACFFLRQSLAMDKELKNMSIDVSFMAALSTFHSVACFLEDLKLLNSELGRIALSSSMISGSISYVAVSIYNIRSLRDIGYANYGRLISIIMLIIVIVFPLRYLLIWLSNRCRQRVKESHLALIPLLVLASAFFSEVIGLHSFFGPTLLGLVFPRKSALADTFLEKNEGFVNFLLLPLFFVSCGTSTSLPDTSARTYFAVLLLAVLGCLAKFLGTILVSVFFCNFAVKDGIILGLMLSSLGVIDLQYYRRSLELKLIDYQCFGVLITSAMITTGFISFIVKAIYDPFERFIAYEKHTIQHFFGNEFRILACVHSEEYVPSIINLLEASNPTIESPICIYLLHLIELIGGVIPMFIEESLETNHRLPHQQLPNKHNNSHCKASENIINAFRYFQKYYDSLVTLRAFTSISPRNTMDNDVYMLSADKKIHLIIIPFHKKWTSNGLLTESPELRIVNQKVIDKAPCSVGILVDRGSKAVPTSVQISSSLYRVCVFFIGGPDDRQAVSYATRMANHPHVTVTLIRLIASLGKADDDSEEKRLDNLTITNFRQIDMTMTDKVVYEETVVADNEETCYFLRSMEDKFDLILVGKRTQSPLLLGLAEWREYPELGVIGDLLASKDFRGKVSILVIQQHIIEPRITLEINDQEEDRLSHQSSVTSLRHKLKSMIYLQ